MEVLDPDPIPPAHMRTSTAILAFALIGVLISNGCASHAPKPATSDRAKLSARTRLLSAPTAAIVVGEPAIITVDPQWGLALDGVNSVRLDDGRTIPIEVSWAAPEKNIASPGWIADFGSWSTQREDRKRPQNRGVRLLSFALPTDSLGQGIWIGSKRIDLQWIPSAEMLAAQGAWAWSSRLTAEQRADTALHKLIAPEATNPLTRWRFKLLTEGLAPAPDESSLHASAFDDPLLETWARQVECIWRTAIRKVQSHDATIAANFVSRLSQIVTLPDGTTIPLWPPTDADLLGLAEDLVHQSVSPQRAASVVEAWLESQPVAAGWVRDDAAGLGTAADTRSPVVLSSVGIVNLSTRPALATLQAGGPPELARLEFSTGIERLLATHPSANIATLPEVHFQMLDWELKRSVVAIPLKVAPPGVSIGPMVPDWTMLEFLRSDEVSLMATRPSDIQVTLTYNAQSATGLGPESLSGWTIVILSLAPPTVQESFTIYMGPATKPSGTLHITSDAAVKSTAFGGSCQTRISRLPTGWGCEIALPSGVIDKAGRLWLGVSTQRTGLGRASWPRPQFPWQLEPGRVIIDTTSWGGLTTDGPAKKP